MVERPLIETSRRLWPALAFAVVLAVGPNVARAQVAAPPPPPPPPAAPQGPVLALSMEQAVAMALESNLGLKADRMNVDVAAQGIASARASFLPTTTSGFTRTTVQQAGERLADGTTAVSSSTTISGQGSVSQNLRWYGGRYTVQWSGNRYSTPSGAGGTFNPRLGSTLNVNFTQPLLRNFKIDGARAGLESAERQRVITDLQLEQTVVGTETNVRLAYLDLVFAIRNLEVAQQNYKLATDSLTQARARVQVGLAAQIDIITNETQVASSQVQLIAAETRIAQAEDALRTIVLDPSSPDFWTTSIRPTDTIVLAPRTIDVGAAITNALANRLDITVLRRNLELTDLNLRVAQNNTLPDVNFNLGYTASGAGGTRLVDGVPDVRGFGAVLGEAFGGTYPTWSTSVSVNYPIGRSAAEANLAQQQIRRRQQDLDLRQLELLIVRQIRDAARQIESSFRQVEAAQAALRLSEQQLEAEDRRFAVGLSTQLDLQFRQRDLAAARINELNAVVAYNRALINFDRVQKIQ